MASQQNKVGRRRPPPRRGPSTYENGYNGRDNMRRSRSRIRMQALEHYGGTPPKCACCGEDRAEFLALDHIDGGGLKARREAGGFGPYPNWLRKNGWPGGIRVLCHNCNMARGLYGFCPHEEPERRGLWPVPSLERTCPMCGMAFMAGKYRPSHVYCSRRCGERGLKQGRKVYVTEEVTVSG